MKKMIEVRFIAIAEELQAVDVAKGVSETVKERLGAELGSLKIREIPEITEEDVRKSFDTV